MRLMVFLSALLCVLVFSGAETARSESPADGSVVMAFTIPPFAEEETVAGIDGWKMISSGNPELAVVRSHGGSQPGLLLRCYGIERLLPERMASQITLTAVVQFGVVADQGTVSTFTFMPIVGVGVGAAPFGFDNADATDPAPGGFFYTEKSLDENDQVVQKRVNLLPRSVAYEGARFTLVLGMDLDEQTYTLAITGTDAGGQPVRAQSEKVSMEVPGRPSVGNQFLNGIRLASGMPASTEFFVESITITPTTH